VKEAQARFEQYLKRRFGQSSTLKHYRSDLNIFIEFIGDDKAPEAVKATDIDAFIDHQIAADLNPSTINRRSATLHTFFEYLAEEKPDLTWPNPVIGRRHYLKLGSRLPRDVSDDDVARLFAVIDDERDRAIFGLMVGAGLRVGEVAAIGQTDVEAPGESGQWAKLRVRGKGNKERMVWLTASLWEMVQAWLKVRPEVESDHLFISYRGGPLSVAGIQYRLKQHCQAAGVRFSCHQLRHTFGRRLSENGLPIDSLAKLLGHSRLETTQRYIDGADPTVRYDFTVAMAHLESSLSDEPAPPASPPQPEGAIPWDSAPRSDLLKLQQRLTDLPPWLAEAVEAYLHWRWPMWRARLAVKMGGDLISLIKRVWGWLDTHRQIDGWEYFGRADLEAWLQASVQDGVSQGALRTYLAHLRGLFGFLERRDWPLDPGLFRVRLPKPEGEPLPRYLPETEYRRLAQVILEATEADTYNAYFDRAWFLTLAHTGVRLSELLDLRVEDLNLAEGYATIRGGKPRKDRVVYLTPALATTLSRYLHHRPDLPEMPYLFVLRGRCVSANIIRHRLKRYGQRTGLSVTPHRLRHTLGTRLINQGVPLQSIRKLLGHRRLNTTQIYARIYDETLYQQFTAAMSRLEAIEVTDWPSIKILEPGVVEPT
jgi:site-specific recombinase XerD